MHVRFVVHESFEAPGAFETWVRERGFTAGYSRVYAYEPLPQTADGIDLLIVMGGPQSPATTRRSARILMRRQNEPSSPSVWRPTRQ